MALLFLWLFLGMLVFSVPMFYLMLAAPGIALWLEGKTVFLNLLMQRLYSGIDSFPLMALPFFILAGEMMTHGGVTRRMAEFANSFVGLQQSNQFSEYFGDIAAVDFVDDEKIRNITFTCIREYRRFIF